MFLFFPFFCFLGPYLAAYGGSQARGLIDRRYSCWPTPQPQQHQICAVSLTYTRLHSNAGSLTHWVRSGIKPTTSWFLVGFLSTVPWWDHLFLFVFCFFCFCFCFCFFCLFAFSRAAPAAYRGSQARDWIGAAAAGLRQSHSNKGSEPHLQSTPQLTAKPDP